MGLHQDFEMKENHWQRVMHFGDPVIAEDPAGRSSLSKPARLPNDNSGESESRPMTVESFFSPR
jgi:hypothetical protein